METINTQFNASGGTYEVYVDCFNCDKRTKVVISRGQKINETPCPNCGCNALKVVSNIRWI